MHWYQKKASYIDSVHECTPVHTQKTAARVRAIKYYQCLGNFPFLREIYPEHPEVQSSHWLLLILLLYFIDIFSVGLFFASKVYIEVTYGMQMQGKITVQTKITLIGSSAKIKLKNIT